MTTRLPTLPCSWRIAASLLLLFPESPIKARLNKSNGRAKRNHRPLIRVKLLFITSSGTGSGAKLSTRQARQ
jgi:hypothetical protein